MQPEPFYNSVAAADQIIPVYHRWFGTWQVAIGRRPLDAAQLAHLYDRHAATWDAKLNRLGVVDAYAQMLGHVSPRWRYCADVPRVLDAGIGTGALSLALCQVHAGPLKLDGIDLSGRMLTEARKRLSRTGYDLRLQQGDITALPYEDDSFDVVMTAHTIEHLGHPKAALGEFCRVLKPGGRLIACITARSVLAAYIQVRWQTHRLSSAQCHQLLQETGFENAHKYRFAKGTPLRKLSVAYIAGKPRI